MKTKEFSSDYTWSTVITDVNDLQKCKGCGRRDETTYKCDVLDTTRKDEDIACAHYLEVTK